MNQAEIHGQVSLGAVLRQHRNARRWSLTEAARQLGLKSASLGMYERGERNPPVETLVAILDGYDLSLVVADKAEIGDVRQARIEALRRELAELEAT
ncbi:MAG TPA: helix-turn-helix transcriptional regulator [Vicinamibacterales bacterium]|nr:helix-turn-helix transcriptional regulator [Vicinamibacterales bacterium]